MSVPDVSAAVFGLTNFDYARQLQAATSTLGLLLADPNNNPGNVARRYGTVVATHTGSTPPTVDILLGGTSVYGVRYLLPYSPAVNDIVAVDVVLGDPVVLGHLAMGGGGDAITFTSNITVNGQLQVGSSLMTGDGWFRSSGATGWYSQTYGAGIFMPTSDNYVRAYPDSYGGGRFYSATEIRGGSTSIGPWNGNAGYMCVAHSALGGAVGCGNNYSLLSDAGNVFLNAVGGNFVFLRQGNNDLMHIRQSGVNVECVFPTGIPPLGGGLTMTIVGASQEIGVIPSSARFKRDIEDLPDPDRGAANPVWRMRPRRFAWADNARSVLEGQDVADLPELPPAVGLVVEELAEIAPAAVVLGSDDLPFGLNDHAVLAYLVDACQHLAGRLDALEESRGTAAA